jgi:hypothetical protein
MSRLIWPDGRAFEIVQNPTFEETATIERALKRGWHTLTFTENTMAHLLVTLRRNGIILQWGEMTSMAIGLDFDIEADEDDEPVPTTPGREAGETESSLAEITTG